MKLDREDGLTIMGKFKNMLKHILPPPVNSFNREINELKGCVQELNTKLNVQLIQHNVQLTQLNAQQKELSAKLADIGRTQQQIVAMLRPPKLDYAYFENLFTNEYEKALKIWYKARTGQDLDLQHPKTFNEKIQWLKLYDSTPLKTRLADKYLVRDWVKEKIGEEYLIPLLGVWNSFDEIDFDKLPERFVLKANHGYHWNYIVKDKTAFDRADAKAKFDKWLGTNFAFNALELQYMNIPPKIIAEEYLENGNSDLYDYKVFCFGGKANSIRYISGRYQDIKEAYFDLDWNKLPFHGNFPKNEEVIPRPKNLNRLIGLAEVLAADFSHVRVDFYVLNDGSLKFGEMTFTTGAGYDKWDPPEQDRIFGDLIKLPPKSPIPERM